MGEDRMESALFRAVSILNSHKIGYWVTDGTLLGIIREDRILPWDSDIDIAVYKSEVSMLNLLDVFTKGGFKHIKTLPEMDCLHFVVDNIQVDIGFYSKEKSKVSIKWATKPNINFEKIKIFIINTIFQYSNNNLFYDYGGSFFKSTAKRVISLFSHVLTNKTKNNLYTYARTKYIYIGSTYPIELLTFKKINFKGNELVVPKDSDEYLRLCYGNDWRVPNEDFIWENDTYNLEKF